MIEAEQNAAETHDESCKCGCNSDDLAPSAAPSIAAQPGHAQSLASAPVPPVVAAAPIIFDREGLIRSFMDSIRFDGHTRAVYKVLPVILNEFCEFCDKFNAR